MKALLFFRSTIVLSDDVSREPGGGRINVSPVRYGYDALWHEYNTTESPETLMIVIRQILEYYFFHLRGYKNKNLRYELLEKHKADFETIRTDGTKDTTSYHQAAAMIAFLNAGATGFNDGLYYDSGAADIRQLRSTFRRIFEVMHQEQHYDMMTGRS